MRNGSWTRHDEHRDPGDEAAVPRYRAGRSVTQGGRGNSPLTHLCCSIVIYSSFVFG